MQVPHIFYPGYAARSAEVNENFAALAEAITTLAQRVDAIEGIGVPIPGSYFLMGYQTGLIPAGAGAIIEGIVYTGNLTLAGSPGATSGSLTLALREVKNELHIAEPQSSRTTKTMNETIEAGWTFTPGQGLALNMPDDDGEIRAIRFARASTRLHIGNHLNAKDGSSVMLFLIRQANA